MLIFFSINPEYNEDSGIVIKAFHVIILNSSEETRVQINDNKPKKIVQLNKQWIKTKRALGVKAMLGIMTNLRKRNCSVHYAISNLMMLIGDGESRGYRMMNENITKLDQLIFPASQAMRTEATKTMKKTKKNNKGWITIGKKM